MILDNGVGYGKMTEWLNLTEGKPYYIEGQLIEHREYEHFTVGVEIDDQVEDHYHQTREVQFLSVESNGTFEKTKFIIDQLDNE